MLRPPPEYEVRALVVDVASDPPKEKIIIIIIIIMNILVRNEQGQRRKKETKHKKIQQRISFHPLTGAYQISSHGQAGQARFTCGVMVMAPAYIYIY